MGKRVVLVACGERHTLCAAQTGMDVVSAGERFVAAGGVQFPFLIMFLLPANMIAYTIMVTRSGDRSSLQKRMRGATMSMDSSD
eukprot:SAG31_NODE_1131_length_9748_cov_3.466473_5_plen_84_part_00